MAVFIVSKRLTPIYESTATIDIDHQTPTGVVGQEADRGLGTDSDQFLLTQVKLIESDPVVRPVAQQFHLILPKVETRDESVMLDGLGVTRMPNTYLLLISYRSPDPNLSAAVANSLARSYRDYTYEIRARDTADLSAFMEQQMQELKARTERSGERLAKFEQELSMINPEQKTSIVSARLLQLNTDYSSAEAGRMAKEAVWRSVQSGTLESLQVSTQGSALEALNTRVTEAKEKLNELQTRVGVKHPEYIKAALHLSELENQFETMRLNVSRRVETEYRQSLAREQMLKREFTDTKAEFDSLNSKSFQYAALKREADTDRSLYDELVRRIKEAGINAGFQNNSIHISDAARPNRTPVYPDIASNLLTTFFLSMFLAVGTALFRDKLDRSIRDAHQARHFLGAEVIGTLPAVRKWKGQLVPANLEGPHLLPRAPETDLPERLVMAGFEEAVGTLRTSILLNTFDRPFRSILFTSAASSEGKTTLAAHFAISHARQNLKTLVIDCDLRRPCLHMKLGVLPETGLAAALRNGLAWREKLVRFEAIPDLSLLPAGPIRHPVTDIVGRSLKRILEEALSEYDLVVVDAPPVPGFSESLQLAAAVDGVVVVTIAGQTDRKAIDAVITNLRRVHAKLLGLVLNEVTSSTSDSYYSHGTYYEYYEHQAIRD